MDLLSQHHSKIEYSNKLFSCAAIIFLLACYFNTLYQFSNISFWKTDALIYLDTYFPKLKYEGRWVNYIFFDFLRQTPGIIAYIVASLCTMIFSWKVVFSIVNCRLYASILALVSIQVPLLTAQMLWPFVSYPAFILLGLSALVVNRMPYFLFFPIFGILFSASLNHFYFLLPLLFLKDITPKRAFFIGLSWVFGFFLGYGVANAVTYLHSGDVIRLADWRNAKYPHSLKEILGNFQFTFKSLFHANHLFYDFVGSIGVVLCSLALLSINLKKDSLLVGVMFACGLATYLAMAPLGLFVWDRTAYVLALPLLGVIFVRHELQGLIKSFHLVALLYIGISLSIANDRLINWHAIVTNKVAMGFSEKLASSVNEDKVIILLPSGQAWRQLVKKIEFCEGVDYVAGQRFDSSYRMKPMLQDIKVEKFTLCKDDCKNSGKAYFDKHSCDNDIFTIQKIHDSTYGLFISYKYLRGWGNSGRLN